MIARSTVAFLLPRLHIIVLCERQTGPTVHPLSFGDSLCMFMKRVQCLLHLMPESDSGLCCTVNVLKHISPVSPVGLVYVDAQVVQQSTTPDAQGVDRPP